MSELKQKWHRIPKGARIISMVVLGLVTAAVLGLVFGIFVRELWNWLMPDLFGFKTISYWQAFGIVILGHLIFGGAAGSHSGGPKSSGRHVKEHETEKDSDMHWKYYDEWWQSRGRQAFDDYAMHMEDKEPDPSEKKD